MAIQTAYTTDPAVAFEGQIADSTIVNEVLSRAVQTGSIAAGRFVVRGTTDTNCALPAASGDIAKGIGITIYSASKGPGDYGAALWNGSVFTPTLGVMRKGHIWVKVEEAVAQNDPVFVRYASGGGGSALGAFRKSADTATAGQILNASGVAAAFYQTSASTGGFAVVEINLP